MAGVAHSYYVIPSVQHYMIDYDTQDYQYDDTNFDGEAEDEEITQEDCWTVISCFFAEKGLVRQQLDSFDEFVQNTMQELVEDNKFLILDQGDQHSGSTTDATVSLRLTNLGITLFLICSTASI